jgi:FAD/FMN-containing dehydrogenase
MNIDALRRRFSGEILTPDSPGYEAGRRLWNGMIDRKPAAIAYCRAPEDVTAAVQFSGEQNIYPSVRAGGHNVAGFALVEDGLVIDISQMKAIQVDAGKQIAQSQTGLLWGEFDAATQAHGLATTGGVISTTGVAGLTLGGGVGWLMGRCGLSCDNTLSYDVVTSKAELVRASDTENRDLFWALKGGAGNFGVVTSITFRLYPITTVISGFIFYPLTEGRDVLRRYRDFVTSGLPDELIVYAAVIRLPDGAPVVSIIPAFCGSKLSAGESYIAELTRFGSVIANTTQRMPYTAMQKMLDPFAPAGIRSYWKSNFLQTLSDDAIDAFVQFAAACPSPQTFSILEHSHGAAALVPVSDTAFPVRSEGFDLVILSLWQDPQHDAENVQWTRAFCSAMRSWSAGSVYVNALSEDDSARVREAFGANYNRLRKVKTAYDPSNRFRQNQNIAPDGQQPDLGVSTATSPAPISRTVL